MRKSVLFRAVAAPLAIAVVGLFLPILTSNPQQVTVATQILFAAVGAYSMWLVLQANLLSLGNAAFMGIGAYVTAILTVDYKWSFWQTIPVVILTTLGVALLFGIITLRLQAIYFAMASFVLLEVFQGLLSVGSSVTGGPSGIAGVPLPESIKFWFVHIDFSGTNGIYYPALFLAVVMIGACTVLMSSRIGLNLKGISASEQLAQSVGISIFGHRLIVLSISAVGLGIAGAFFVAFTRLASPSSFALSSSIDWLVYAVLGSILGVVGPFLAAVFLVGLTHIVFTRLGVYEPMLYGLLLVAAVLLQARGATLKVRWPGSWKLRQLKRAFLER